MATTVVNPRLEKVWEAQRPLTSVFGTVDHKVIGKRYILTAFLFFSLAGIEALLSFVHSWRCPKILSSALKLIINSSPCTVQQ